MKHGLLTNLLFVCSSLVTSAALAEQNVWFESEISSIYPQANGDFVLVLKEISPECNQANDARYYSVSVGENGVTTEGSEKLFTTALTAASNNKKINMKFDASSSQCFVNRLYIQF